MTTFLGALGAGIVLTFIIFKVILYFVARDKGPALFSDKGHGW